MRTRVVRRYNSEHGVDVYDIEQAGVPPELLKSKWVAELKGKWWFVVRVSDAERARSMAYQLSMGIVKEDVIAEYGEDDDVPV